MSALVIDQTSSDERLQLAGEVLERCSGVVVLEGVATLWPKPYAIECAIADPLAKSARCEEEYRVLVENAARALESSRLSGCLPRRPLQWVVVDEYGQRQVYRLARSAQ